MIKFVRKISTSLRAQRSNPARQPAYGWVGSLHSLRFLAITFFVFSGFLPCVTSAVDEPALIINSPANETVVQPGSTIKVVVTAINPQGLKDELVMGRGNLITAMQPANATTEFSLTIPADIHPDRYYITAVGGLKAGGVASSNPVSLIIPVTGQVSSIRAQLKTLVLDFPGNQGDLSSEEVVTPEGRITLDTRQFTFTSDNPQIASVDSNGTVTAQAIGTTQIIIRYASQGGTLYTNVSVIVEGGTKGDLNADKKVDIDDIHILESYLQTFPSFPANGPNDARDLNHDGKIDGQDLEILKSLCTYPNCATSLNGR